MSNGNGVQSVSLADGTLSPDLRVNYTFGLVLGVNEFQQEQQYLLQKAYLYNRAFQGYGTVSGLHVRADWQKGEDLLVTVSPGMAIDQYGMPIVVREAQCAYLAAWLTKQEKQQPGTIDKHRRKGERWERLWKEGKKRDLRIYIIARYDDYADGQVPIAGQACSTSDTQPIYSRVHDSYTIDFSWDSPSLPAWESMRCFSKLLARVRFTDEDERDDTRGFIEEMRKLADPDSISLCSSPAKSRKRDDDEKRDRDDRAEHHSHHEDGDDEREHHHHYEDEDDEEHHHEGEDDKDEEEHRHHENEERDDDETEPRWYIPAARARTSLDHIFMTWVTEVRPQLLPNLLDPKQVGTKAQPDILLAHIDFTLNDEFPDAQPQIKKEGWNQANNRGRPFLLPAQLMQELLLAGQRESERIDGEGHGRPVREFATLQVRNNHTLHAWVHYPYKLFIEGDRDDWGRMLEVRSNGQSLAIERVWGMAQNVFEIEVRAGEGEQGGGVLRPGARVELVFKADEIKVERGEDEKKDRDEDLHEEVEDRLKEVGHEIKEEVKEAGEKVETEVHEARDVGREIAGEIQKGAGAIVADIGKAEEHIGEALERTLGIGEDAEESGEKLEETGKKIEKEGQEKVSRAEADEKRLDRKERAEEVKEKEKEERQKLSEGIHGSGFHYVGYDRNEKVVIVYTIAAHIPRRELATFFVYDQESDEAKAPNLPHAELRKVTTAERFLALWFHTEYPVILPPQVRVLRAFMHQQPQELVMRTVAPAGETSSWFWALEPPEGIDELKLVPGELLAVYFNTNEIGVVRGNEARALTWVMREMPFTCVGYDGDHTVELYHQVSFNGSRDEEREQTTGSLPAGQRSPAPEKRPAPSLPFVTIQPLESHRGSAEGPVEVQFQLWFHLSADPRDNRPGFTDDLTFEALLEDGREMRIVPVEATRPARRQHNVYTSTLMLPPPEREQRFYYLRLRFPLDANEVSMGGEREGYPTLGAYMRARNIGFEGYNGDDSILAYIRTIVPPPNTGRSAQAAR